jgi:hypothetical protein
VAGLLPSLAFSDYVEGIDTTDTNGYGLDSAFVITGYGPYIWGNSLHGYGFGDCGGFYNYTFGDIAMAPEKLVATGVSRNLFGCFILRNNRDSTYSKIQVLQHVSGFKYIYRCGTNTTRNNRMLTQSNYDHSLFWKPNNLACTYGFNPPSTIISWEPPLLNNNHLLGYILYGSKIDAAIDTNAPVNMAQWDSLSFSDSTSMDSRHSYLVDGQYFNLVAVYAEGRSGFLSGFTRLEGCSSGGAILKPSALHSSLNAMQIARSTAGFLITLNRISACPFSIVVFSLSGQEMVCLPVNGKQAMLTNRNLREGLYILRAQLPDKTVLTRTFMFTR